MSAANQPNWKGDADRAGFCDPLFELYRREGQPLPRIEQMEAGDLPEPCRELLAHDRDMTPTLESACGCEIRLDVLRSDVGSDEVWRFVVLRRADGAPALAGAIRIHLRALTAGARQAVIERREPFGAILRREQLPHRSRPTSAFRIEPDALLTQALSLQGHGTLYGRCNTLWDLTGRVLAEVVEILPPAAPFKSGESR